MISGACLTTTNAYENRQVSLAAEVLGDEGFVDDDDDDRGPRRQRSSWAVYAVGPRVWRM